MSLLPRARRFNGLRLGLGHEQNLCQFRHANEYKTINRRCGNYDHGIRIHFSIPLVIRVFTDPVNFFHLTATPVGTVNVKGYPGTEESPAPWSQYHQDRRNVKHRYSLTAHRSTLK